MARVLVTFDVNNSDNVSYKELWDMLAENGYLPTILASDNRRYTLPYNTYVKEVNGEATPTQVALAEVKRLLASKGWTARAIIAAEYTHATFNGPIA